MIEYENNYINYTPSVSLRRVCPHCTSFRVEIYRVSCGLSSSFRLRRQMTRFFRRDCRGRYILILIGLSVWIWTELYKLYVFVKLRKYLEYEQIIQNYQAIIFFLVINQWVVKIILFSLERGKDEKWWDEVVRRRR